MIQVQQKNLLMLFAVAVLFAACSRTTEPNANKAPFFAVLDSQMQSLESGEYHTMDRISELGHLGKDSNEQIVDLLDYYLGSAGGEVLQEIITSRGQAIEPLLLDKRKSPIDCLPNYQVICVSGIEHRNSRIDELVSAIRGGVVLKAAD